MIYNIYRYLISKNNLIKKIKRKISKYLCVLNNYNRYDPRHILPKFHIIKQKKFFFLELDGYINNIFDYVLLSEYLIFNINLKNNLISKKIFLLLEKYYPEFNKIILLIVNLFVYDNSFKRKFYKFFISKFCTYRNIIITFLDIKVSKIEKKVFNSIKTNKNYFNFEIKLRKIFMILFCTFFRHFYMINLSDKLLMFLSRKFLSLNIHNILERIFSLFKTYNILQQKSFLLFSSYPTFLSYTYFSDVLGLSNCINQSIHNMLIDYIKMGLNCVFFNFKELKKLKKIKMIKEKNKIKVEKNFKLNKFLI
ncbi:hypothetical protein [Guillardia theta]|uniref:Uncharacterized protein n=1 Tax=Guillardia theta TaxID=55529 RepID=Q9AVZ0_GUITH|nr:hypothetical protein GTHECHR2173 [Guillardia theta]CAC27081.1 hypothetical protein [Guillardia theta]